MSLFFAVGSDNAAKLKAVAMAVKQVFPSKTCIIKGFKVPSGVSNQPLSAEETLQGATHRAEAALHASLACVDWSGALVCTPSSSGEDQKVEGEWQNHANGADFGIGLEGGIEPVGSKWFECGWIAVVDRSGKQGFGSSARFLVSDSIASRLLGGEELADVIQDITGLAVRDGLGMMGLITAGHLPRAECYLHGMIFAFGPWLSEDFWWK
eukprot:TRINITY_DN16602_c0_g1_i1.p1 TRINITY_DN16602_c0_g1~~TRINITY_DN16602_c0_g1_i1.p1  ORF type:complete len:210 (+),score=37.98 TRINITY_DN16602_c0_g1_i1:77-706(+)